MSNRFGRSNRLGSVGGAEEQQDLFIRGYHHANDLDVAGGRSEVRLYRRAVARGLSVELLPQPGHGSGAEQCGHHRPRPPRGRSCRGGSVSGSRLGSRHGCSRWKLDRLTPVAELYVSWPTRVARDILVAGPTPGCRSPEPDNAAGFAELVVRQAGEMVRRVDRRQARWPATHNRLRSAHAAQGTSGGPTMSMPCAAAISASRAGSGMSSPSPAAAVTNCSNAGP